LDSAGRESEQILLRPKARPSEQRRTGRPVPGIRSSRIVVGVITDFQEIGWSDAGERRFVLDLNELVHIDGKLIEPPRRQTPS